MTDLVATYRVQLNRARDLRSASALIGWLPELGVSHLYVSPLTQAVPDSDHGYDVVDPGRVSTDLGGSAALAQLIERLRSAGMGLLLDLVPNHRAAHRANEAWWALLRDGRDGHSADLFDVEWDAPGAGGKVVVPMLADDLDVVLAREELTLHLVGDEPTLRYGDHELPVAPGTIPAGTPVSAVAALLEAQHYQLVCWRRTDLVNYRRFLDIWWLPAVRVERPDGFQAQHGLVLRLLADGVLDGVRVDHVDGLRDPRALLARLRAAGADWLLVEKVLATGEQLRDSLGADGTTGYEFADRVCGVLVDPDGEEPLTEIWHAAAGDGRAFESVVRDSRAQVLEELFPSDVDRVVRALARAAIIGRDVREAVVALLAELDVYRTYVSADGVADDVDVIHVRRAQARARQRVSPGAIPALDAVVDAWLGSRDAPDARMRLQQLASAVAAKGGEDTALYRYFRSPARNEVGSDPGRFAWSPAEFHDANRADAARSNRGLLALSTHDTKRSGDVRARLAVLTEMPRAWAAFLDRCLPALTAAWEGLTPDMVAHHLLLQSVVGTWPISRERLVGYVRKASREAKRRTSWLRPDEEYEEALGRLVDEVVDGSLADDVARFARVLLVPGRLNALSQVLLQCVGCGVPDIYEGDELWNLSLVDPDNRRPLTHDARPLLAALREADGPPADALNDLDDPGLPKLWTVSRALSLRARRNDCFHPGASYHPVEVRGQAAEHVLGFVRGDDVVAVAQRLTTKRADGWGDTRLVLGSGHWHDVLSDSSHHGEPSLAQVLSSFPVAVLERR